ncbi:hypothetical protein PRIPAC_74619 [Pristionchus pacificus]|uniref:Uncharacterized protein n=1 Tax=Pristionchus pacificus TaxID=54126 RepID=A0A2A6BR96_PRIPA|nr:hypothetical protein PRIPAC_74619 [Pristionchus pacificus]|eukprot:PDM68449.1 hypothetical protein PRIPAC_43951 [Pristionchus pacificus]
MGGGAETAEMNCLPFGDAAGAAGRAGGGGRPGDGEAGGGRGGGAARAPPLSSASLVRSRSSQKDDEVWMVTGVSMGTEAAAAGAKVILTPTVMAPDTGWHQMRDKSYCSPVGASPAAAAAAAAAEVYASAYAVGS